MRRHALAHDRHCFLLVFELLAQFGERTFDERRRFHAISDIAQKAVNRFKLLSGSRSQLYACRFRGLRLAPAVFVRVRMRMFMIIHAVRFRSPSSESYAMEAGT